MTYPYEFLDTDDVWFAILGLEEQRANEPR
jgi:hypothetical protein